LFLFLARKKRERKISTRRLKLLLSYIFAYPSKKQKNEKEREREKKKECLTSNFALLWPITNHAFFFLYVCMSVYTIKEKLNKYVNLINLVDMENFRALKQVGYLTGVRIQMNLMLMEQILYSFHYFLNYLNQLYMREEL
jgi:hypothetical protein